MVCVEARQALPGGVFVSTDLRPGHAYLNRALKIKSVTMPYVQAVSKKKLKKTVHCFPLSGIFVYVIHMWFP